MRNRIAALALALALAGCSQGDFSQGESAPASEGYAVEEAAVMDEMAENRAQAAPAPTDADDAATGGSDGGPSQPSGPSPVLYLAYSYQTALELPSARVPTVMQAHLDACQAAGPRQCQLIGSNVHGDPENYVEGYVSLRGEPAWLRGFMGGLESQADAAGGRIVSRSTNTEDLTRAIVDTEARLSALTALRDRLQNLLRNRPGRLSDLLEVERELARVQGEIDSIQSNLAVMRTRVAMSELTLSYRSQPRAVGSDTFRPLRDAFANFFGIVIAGLAAIVTIIAGLIPVALVVVPIVWLLLRWRRQRGGRFFNRNGAEKPAQTAPAETSD